jgi:hypothetical protein
MPLICSYDCISGIPKTPVPTQSSDKGNAREDQGDWVWRKMLEGWRDNKKIQINSSQPYPHHVRARMRIVYGKERGHFSSLYSKSGSPTCSISWIVQRRSKAFESTILNICATVSMRLELLKGRIHTFCTLMLWLVLLKIRLAFMAFAKRLA